MTWTQLQVPTTPIIRRQFSQYREVPARGLPRATRMRKLAVDSSAIPLSFTRERYIDPETLKPGTFVADIGRHSVLRSTNGRGEPVAVGVIGGNIFAQGIGDHHQLPRGRCAAEIIWHNRDRIANAGTINHIQTHQDPDLDAVASVMLLRAIARHGMVPELDARVEGFVQYVRSWDGGSLEFGDIAALRQTLGIVEMGIREVVKKRVAREVLDELGLQHLGQVFGRGGNPVAFLTPFNARVHAAQVEASSQFISGLLASGYDFRANNGQILAAHVPKAHRTLYREGVAAMETDLYWFARQRGEAFDITCRSEVDGRTTEMLKSELSMNTVNAYFPYLYATGIMLGVVYKENIPVFPNQQPNSDCQADNMELCASKIVIGVNPQAGASVAGVELYLNQLEIDERRRLGVSTTPTREPVFWKQGVEDRVVLTVEGSVLPRSTLLEALRVFQP